MTYVPQRDVNHLIEKIKPAAQLLRVCVLEADTDEDPIELFLRRLSGNDLRLEDVRADLRVLLPAFHWPWFLTQIGLTQELSFFSETFRRVEESFLPPLQRPNEVSRLVQELFRGSLDWLEKLKPHHLEKLLSAFTRTDLQLPEAFVQDLHLSLEILAQRLSGLGLDILIAKHLRDQSELHREFLELGRMSFTERDKSKALENLLFLNGLKNCEKAVAFIRGQSEVTGISLALTYRLVQIEELINRLKLLLALMQAAPGRDCHRKLGEMMRSILLAHSENAKVGAFLGRNFEILAYQITLLAERTGEHYIANNSRELKAMWWKATKAALVVPVLVILKVLASKWHLPPVPQAFTYGSIYAVGFVIIHEIGGALATKQPAMTASTLAAAMDNAENSEEAVDNLLEAVVRTLRTQVAALLGNYLFAFPIAVLLVFPFVATGHPVVDFVKSDHMLAELHPFKSLSFLYAATAGVCLFLSGLVSGLADNWFAFNQIGDRLEMRLSGERGRRFVASLRENFGIWTGNIVLGFMLGSAAAFGSVSGLPVDIRHVTFSSGSFGVGWIHQEHLLPWSAFALLAFAVLVMGAINLSVSFSLALFVAMKSRRLHFKQGRRLAWLLLKRLITRPHDLFFDPEK